MDRVGLGQVHQLGEHFFGAAFFQHGRQCADVFSEIQFATHQRRHPNRFLMAHRLCEGVVDPLVARMVRHGDGCQLDALGLRHLPAGQNRLEPHERMGIVRRKFQQAGRVGQAIVPTPRNAGGERSRPVVFRAQHTLEQARLHGLGHRAKRQRLEQVTVVQRIVLLQIFHKADGHIAHLKRFMMSDQLELGLLPRPPLGRFELLDQLRPVSAFDLWPGGKRLVLHRQPPDAAVVQIARRVAEVVVLMADDRVVKVGDIDRTVRADADVHRSKVPVARLEHRLLPVKFEAGTGRRQREAAHGVRLVIIQHKLAAHRLRHVPAIDHLHATVAPGIADTVEPQSVLRGNRCRREIRDAARAIDDQRLAPVVKHNAPRIPRPHEIVKQSVELQAARSQSIHPGLIEGRHAPRCFHS